MRQLRLAVLPLLLVACAEQSPVEPVASSPAFNLMNYPDNGNFRIFRAGVYYGYCYTDPDNGLRACIANTPLGGGTEPDCGLQDFAEPLDWQQVLTDEDSFRVISNMTGDAFITVRDVNAGGVCFGNDLVAEGWGTMRYIDNDIYGSGGNSKNAFRNMAQGVLTTPSGETLRFAGHAAMLFTASEGLRAVSLKVGLH